MSEGIGLLLELELSILRQLNDNSKVGENGFYLERMLCIKTWYQPQNQNTPNHSPNTAGFNNIFQWLIRLEFAVSGGERGVCGYGSGEWRLPVVPTKFLLLSIFSTPNKRIFRI